MVDPTPRSPQVDLHFERRHGGSTERVRLPFRVLVIADLAGHAKGPDWSRRQPFVFDRQDFDAALHHVRPRLELRVDDTLHGGDNEFPVELYFASMADFMPDAVARRVPQLAALLDRRAEFLPPERAVAGEPSLLDEILASTVEARGEAVRGNSPRPEVDQVVGAQLDAILHHPEFQRLEAAWRGLQHFVVGAEGGDLLQIELLPTQRENLQSDLSTAVEMQESSLWRQLRVDPDRPVGLLVADFEFSRSTADIDLLRNLARIAAALHAPLLAAAAPALVGAPDWAGLREMRRFDQVFDKTNPTNTKWLALRDSEEARFLALVLPRFLLRPPHDSSSYTEAVSTPADCLWGNAAYLLAGRTAAAFTHHGWGLDIVGAAGGGRVEGLAVHTSRDGVLLAGPLEVAIPETQARELGPYGLVPVVMLPQQQGAFFPQADTVQRPRRFADNSATASAALSAQLPQVMAVSRFVHHLVALRTASPGVDTAGLAGWLEQFVADGEAGSQAGRPLRDAFVETEPIAAVPGRLRAFLGLCIDLPGGGNAYVQTTFELLA